jgi:mannose-6-phosphate isomerase-like protein (cupin superfamily)
MATDGYHRRAMGANDKEAVMSKPQPVKDASHLYDVERRAEHATRPGFRIVELQLSATQKVPWHTHSQVSDTFYVLEGQMRLFLQEPKEEVNQPEARRGLCRPADTAASGDQWRHDVAHLPGPARRRRI